MDAHVHTKIDSLKPRLKTAIEILLLLLLLFVTGQSRQPDS